MPTCMCRLSAFVEAHSAVLPYMLPLPRFFNLGVGEAGPKNLGEAENCILMNDKINLLSTN